MHNMDADALSQEFADSVLPVTIIIGILAVCGLLGNSSVIYVYKWKYSKCNFRTFVLCLAMVDFTSCLFVFPTEMAGHRIWFSYPKSAAWFCKLKTSIYATAVFISSYILLLISVDRFRKVCRPLGWQISQNVALRLCLFIFGLSMILIIPCPILFGIQTSNITYEGQHIVITSCGRDDDYKDSIWITIYVAIFYYVTVISFMVTTMVLYGMILRILFCGNFLKEIDHTEELKRKSRLHMAESSRDETKDGLFSSDTFLDFSSTCADEHNIKDEPKLIKIESRDRLCIQYTAKNGKLKTETIKYTTSSHIEGAINPGRKSGSVEMQTNLSDKISELEGLNSNAQTEHETNGTVESDNDKQKVKSMQIKCDIEDEIETAKNAVNVNVLETGQDGLGAETRIYGSSLKKNDSSEKDLQTMLTHLKSMNDCNTPDDNNALSEQCDDSSLNADNSIIHSHALCAKLETKTGKEHERETTITQCGGNAKIPDHEITVSNSHSLCATLKNKAGQQNDPETIIAKCGANTNIANRKVALNSIEKETIRASAASNENTTKRIFLDPLKGVVNKSYIPDAEIEINSDKPNLLAFDSDDKLATACIELENRNEHSDESETAVAENVDEKRTQDFKLTQTLDSEEDNSEASETILDTLCIELVKRSVHSNELETAITESVDKKRVPDLKLTQNLDSEGDNSKAIVQVHRSIDKNNDDESKETPQNTAIHKPRKHDKYEQKHASDKQRIRNKSLIMFVVTLIFNITTLIYFCIFTVVIRSEHIFEIVTPQSTGVFFFFWRVYFINHVINPVVYGSLDPRFRQVLKKSWRRITRKHTKHSLRPH